MDLKVDELALDYASSHDETCAIRTWSLGHLIPIVVVAEALLLALLYGPLVLMAFVALSVTLIVFAVVCFRLIVVAIAVLADPEEKVTEGQIAMLRHQDMPVYTILVPLYREATIAEGVIRALDKLDYPRNKLDIKLLLEADDAMTVEAVRRVELGPEYEVISVPPSLPRTKPKACNHGLARAHGEYLVIFDAEDRPESDQLLKSVAAFRELPPDTMCLQAKLNYYNPRDNFLTKCFTLEYTAWFDLMLPGLQWLGGPIPLGGTSNHFRTQMLKKLGGWDPFNVTEDCELGVRLSIHGYHTKLLNSTTWEEANNRMGNWLRQRSRWVKGYMQTHLVHTHKPFSLLAKLGPWKTLLFLFSVAGVALQQLLNLVCLPVLLVYMGLLLVDAVGGRNPWTVIAGSRDEYRVAWKSVYWDLGDDPVWMVVSIVGFLSSVAMLLSNLLFVAVNLIACQRRGYRDLWFAALASPAYWVLGSVAAWKGAIQLVLRPHYWEKTVHGLSKTAEVQQ